MSNPPQPMILPSSTAAPDLTSRMEITRKLADGAAFEIPHQTVPPLSTSRTIAFEFDLSETAYALAIGPRSTYDEVIVTLQGEISKSAIALGPIREKEPFVVTKDRPFIGELRPGKYTVYFSKPLPFGNHDWVGYQPFGDEWITNTGAADEPFVVTGTQQKSVTTFDLIAYHHPVWLATLPSVRAPHEVRFKYFVDVISTGWDLLLPVATPTDFMVHSQGRKRADFAFHSQAAAGKDTWAVEIYGVNFINAGDTVRESLNLLTTIAMASTDDAFYQNPTLQFDGYIVRITRSQGADTDDIGDFSFTAKVSD